VALEGRHFSNKMETENYLSFDEESMDGEEIVLEGIRRSQNRTNWLYQGTALTTTDRMDIESLQWHLFYLQEISLLLVPHLLL
jgi:hypothetical protein